MSERPYSVNCGSPACFARRSRTAPCKAVENINSSCKCSPYVRLSSRSAVYDACCGSVVRATKRLGAQLVTSVSNNLLALAKGRKFKTILADPPWQFQNSTGKVAPEHRRLNRYSTMTLAAIKELPV